MRNYMVITWTFAVKTHSGPALIIEAGPELHLAIDFVEGFYQPSSSSNSSSHTL